ncbi:MAG TPA: 4-hydroxybutyryl-CoA dehydratase [Clostridia bacterium]|nr:4-hydroxybutyryl-CoA dehydratase [Clostridia bacterium]
MGIKTAEEYVESLRKLNLEVYFMGERIENPVDHPAIRPHINSAAVTYQFAHDPEYEDLATAVSHLTGKKINRFTHIHQSTDDLVKKIKLLRAIGQQTGTCFQRCVGYDAMNAIYATSFEIDQKYGTEYHERFKKYLTYVQDNDLMCTGGMTDPKGDRSLPPGKQADPDLYLHVVKELEDGIVVRGAKAHQTGAVNSHEILVMPTTALRAEDKEYAVCFAVPADAEGIFYIFGRQTNDERKLTGEIDQGNAKYAIVGGEALVVFEDVFVPWERVFMYGETDFSGMLVERFASYHRQNYGACKVGVTDVLIGAAALIAEYNGTEKASHIRDKIIEMIHLTETMHTGSLASAYEGVQLPAGSYYVNTMYANTVKHNITRFIYEICRLAHDVAGGLLATLPSEQDLKHPKLGPYIEKYFKGVASVPTEHRIRICRLLENMTGGTALVESMHGAGSPQAQRVMMYREANLEQKKKLAKKLAGIED